MGDRNGSAMPGRRNSTSNDAPRPHSNDDDDEQYYMARMREILNGFPNTGPPTYPVQILDHVYMGNQRNADNVELLRRYGITHVVNCAGQRRFDFSRSPYPKESGIKGFLMISAEDSEDFDIASHFDEAIAFLDRVKKTKGKALVHCNLGVNRSGAVVAAYLMTDQKRTLLDTINYLKVKRFVVLSNKGFRRQLITFARNRGLLDAVIRYPTDNPTSVQQDGSTARERRGQRDEAEATTDSSKRKTPQGASYPMTYVTNNDLSSNSVDRKYDAKKDKSKTADIGDDTKRAFSPSLPEVEVGVRNRLWTLPRYVRSQDRPSVEVVVSEHKESEKSVTTAADRAESKSRSKVVQPLSPVYETRSCDAGGSGSFGAARPSTTSESVSAKLSGFFNLLGPKKPLRSTSYSNVSTSNSAATSTAAAGGTAPTSGSDDPTSGSSSLSTSRPLRIYTRSCTDSEIYRSRQGGTPTAGQLRLPRPASKP